ncbi:MAG TPA: TolC family protein, partial [Candidatus Acidoferrum sp.]|nr:TolC family protein [Candidatus Acidoferrum sp.]
MRRLIPAAVLACAVLTSGPALAEPVPRPLNLRGAVRYALAHDPNVLAKRSTVAQNESTFAQNHANEFPAISGLLQNQMSKNNGNTAGTFQQFGLQQSQVFSQNTAQVGATYKLYNGSLNQINAQQARRQVEAARADERRSEQLLARDVANAWYGLLQRHEAVLLAKGDLAYQRQLLDAARMLERRGRVAGVDVLRAQTNELRSEAALISAEADDANAREALAQRIGAPLDTTFALPADVPEPPLPATPLQTLVADAIAARPDIGSARAEIDVAKLADAAIETDRRPSIQLTGAFGNQETPASTFFNQGAFPFTRNMAGF